MGTQGYQTKNGLKLGIRVVNQRAIPRKNERTSRVMSDHRIRTLNSISNQSGHVLHCGCKVLSSAINLCIPFILLMIVMLITGVSFHKSMLLLPVVVVYLIMFRLGVSLILSTLNVSFRGMTFLWSVVLTMLNFLTTHFLSQKHHPGESDHYFPLSARKA